MADSFIDSFESAGEGWLYSEWMGHVLPAGSGWYFHAGIGWFWTESPTADGFWIHDLRMGFLWSSRDAFPVFGDPLRGRFFALHGSTPERLRQFYDWLRTPAEWVDETILYFPKDIVLRDQRRTDQRGVVRQFRLEFDMPVVRITSRDGNRDGDGEPEGDADLFLRSGGTAQIDDFDYHSRNVGNAEEILLFNVPAGEYGLRAEAADGNPANYFTDLDISIEFFAAIDAVTLAPASGMLGGRAIAFWAYPDASLSADFAAFFRIEVASDSSGAFLIEPLDARAFQPDSFVYSPTDALNGTIDMSFSTDGANGALNGSVRYELLFTASTAGVFSATFEIANGGATGIQPGTYTSAGAFQLY